MKHVMVYINDAACNPAGSTQCSRINVGGGGCGLPACVTWTSPLEKGLEIPDDPATEDVDESNAGTPFDRLALWSSSWSRHDLGGDAKLDIAGVFFTPYAEPFRLAGQAQQDLDRAQFISKRLTLSGQATIRMRPDPRFVLEFPLFGVALIR